MLSLNHIEKSYRGTGGKVEALKGVDLEVSKGEFLAIMGKSGCGKSTVLNILGCMDGYDSGTYLIEEKDTKTLDRKGKALLRRQKFGFVFQAFHLLPELTVFQNAALPLAYKKLPKSKWRAVVLPLLERLDLAHLENRRPCELSGDEQQRTAIARSLANDPEVLLADEPTGNLDSENSERVMELLAGLRLAGRKTLVLVTHDVKIASYADRVVEMRDGRIV